MNTSNPLQGERRPGTGGLPRNAMGKVQKNLLRDRFADACQS